MRQFIPIVLTPQDIARFWTKVDKSGDCWLWQASTYPFGHGQFVINRKALGAHRVSLGAHRVSWVIAHGPIPDGLYVCHDCPGGDNPRCVNPAHLFLGTAQDNTGDMMAKGRHVLPGPGTACRGEAHGHAKLTDQQVREIRAASAMGVSGRALGRQYGVSETTIRDVLRGRLWTHVV